MWIVKIWIILLEICERWENILDLYNCICVYIMIYDVLGIIYSKNNVLF